MPDPGICPAIVCRHRFENIHDLRSRCHPLPRLSRHPIIPPGQQTPSQVELVIISCLLHQQMQTLRKLPHLPPIVCKALVGQTMPYLTQSTSGIVTNAVIPTIPHTAQSCAGNAPTRNATYAPQHLPSISLGLIRGDASCRTNHVPAIIPDPKPSTRDASCLVFGWGWGARIYPSSLPPYPPFTSKCLDCWSFGLERGTTWVEKGYWIGNVGCVRYSVEGGGNVWKYLSLAPFSFPIFFSSSFGDNIPWNLPSIIVFVRFRCSHSFFPFSFFTGSYIHTFWRDGLLTCPFSCKTSITFW